MLCSGATPSCRWKHGWLAVIRRAGAHRRASRRSSLRREDQKPSWGWGESATRHDPFSVSPSGPVGRRRWPGALAAAAIFLVSLLVPSAGDAPPDPRAPPRGRPVPGFPGVIPPAALPPLPPPPPP